MASDLFNKLYYEACRRDCAIGHRVLKLQAANMAMHNNGQPGLPFEINRSNALELLKSDREFGEEIREWATSHRVFPRYWFMCMQCGDTCCDAAVDMPVRKLLIFMGGK